MNIYHTYLAISNLIWNTAAILFKAVCRVSILLFSQLIDQARNGVHFHRDGNNPGGNYASIYASDPMRSSNTWYLRRASSNSRGTITARGVYTSEHEFCIGRAAGRTNPRLSPSSKIHTSSPYIFSIFLCFF